MGSEKVYSLINQSVLPLERAKISVPLPYFCPEENL